MPFSCPLTRNIIAAGRWIAGEPALPVDWDWGKSWQENEQQGALPSSGLLLAGRYAVGALFPLTLILLFLTAMCVAGERAAVIAVLLMAGNALVLLHTRRSMAEGALLFTQTLSLWALVSFERRRWGTAIPAALAFSAKQTLAAMMPVSFLAVIWRPGSSHHEDANKNRVDLLRQGAVYCSLLIAVTLLLHPFLWEQPIPALKAGATARQQISGAQQADRPEQTLNTIDKKIIGMIGSLYLTPPIFAETSNYTNETRGAEQAYLSNPLHSLFRSLPAGAALLALNLFGFAAALGDLRRAESTIQRRLALLAAATLLQTVGLLIFIPLPWQRYYLPLIPYACLWTAYGINALIQFVVSRRDPANRVHNASRELDREPRA